MKHGPNGPSWSRSAIIWKMVGFFVSKPRDLMAAFSSPLGDAEQMRNPMGGEIYGQDVETTGPRFSPNFIGGFCRFFLQFLEMWNQETPKIGHTDTPTSHWTIFWGREWQSEGLKVGRVDCARTIRVEQVEGFSDFIYLILCSWLWFFPTSWMIVW